jgi:ribosomal protein S18 acetylase RimI-like enzyme
VARAARTAVELRAADESDLDAVLALMVELATPQLALSRRGRNVTDPRDRDVTRAGLLGAIDDSERCLVVAELDGSIAGFALLSIVPSSSLSDEPSLRADPIVVARRARRRGVGRALVSAAADFAEDRALATMTVAVRPVDRDGNRYFARLGFVPIEVRRVAPVAAVRRAVGAGRHEPTLLPGTHVGVTPALRRRRLRAARAGSVSKP